MNRHAVNGARPRTPLHVTSVIAHVGKFLDDGGPQAKNSTVAALIREMSKHGEVRGFGRRSGSGPCPSPTHDNQELRPTLAYHACDDGRVAIECAAGCSPAALADLLGIEREVLMVPDRSLERTGTATPATDATADDALGLVCLGDVQPAPVEWLWPSRLARGKLTILAGHPGLGKSYVACDIAARTSVGGTWPDGERAPLGRSVIFTAEDALNDTVLPRLKRLGANLVQIAAQGPGVGHFSLGADLVKLERSIVGRDVNLVVIDPIDAYLGDVNSNVNADVRGLLAPLADLAARRRVAILAIKHLTKDANRSAIARIQASIAFAAAARVVLAIAADPGDRNRSLIGGIKSNVGPVPDVLAFRREGNGLVWEPHPAHVDIEKLLREGLPDEPRQQQRAVDRAKGFLAQLFAESERRSARSIHEEAREDGILPWALHEAKETLKIASKREGGKAPPERGSWSWEWPMNSPTRPRRSA